MIVISETQDNAARWLALALSLAGVAEPVFAQPAASRVSPNTLAPDNQDTPSDVTLGGALYLETPAGADQLSVTLGSIEVVGGEPAFADAINAATAGLAGTPSKVSDLYAAARKIEAAYAQAERVLTRVTIPPQHISDGSVFKILIVDGFIESIDDHGVPDRARAAVRRQASPLIGAHKLTLAEIERRVLLAGQTPGVQLRSTLTPGSAVGAVKLVLTSTWKPTSYSISAENNLGAAFGDVAFSTQVSINNGLGQGELIYAQATSGPDIDHLFDRAPRRRIVGLGVASPIGDSGLAFNPEYIRVDTNPKPVPGAAEVSGQFERIAFRLRYPLILSRSQSLDLTGGLDLIEETAQVRAFDLTVNHDRLRVANVGIRWAYRLGDNARVTIEPGFSQGLSGLGARSVGEALASGVPLSRQGTRPDFSKFTARLKLDNQLVSGLALSSVLRGQLSDSGALPASALFSLDGTDGVSGFSQGSLSVDSGVTARSELNRPVRFVAATVALVTPYGFAAYGAGKLVRPTALEPRTTDTWSYGLGARTLIRPTNSDQTLVGQIEFSRAPGLGESSARTHLTVSLTSVF